MLPVDDVENRTIVSTTARLFGQVLRLTLWTHQKFSKPDECELTLTQKVVDLSGDRSLRRNTFSALNQSSFFKEE